MNLPHLKWKFPPLIATGNGFQFKNWTIKDILRFNYICKRLYGKNIRGVIIKCLLNHIKEQNENLSKTYDS